MFDGRSSRLLERSIVAVPQTKRRIFKALNELVAEKAFGKISVSEICWKAGVSKSTFYRHFDGRDAVVEWHWDLVAGAGVYEIGRTLTWEEGHQVTTAGISSAFALYASAAKAGNGLTGTVPSGARNRRANIFETLRDYRRVEVTERLEFQTIALVAAEFATMDELFTKADDKNVERFADLLTSIVPKDLYDALSFDGDAPPSDASNPWDALR